jgi:hypothetical protein
MTGVYMESTVQVPATKPRYFAVFETRWWIEIQQTPEYTFGQHLIHDSMLAVSHTRAKTRFKAATTFHRSLQNARFSFFTQCDMSILFLPGTSVKSNRTMAKRVKSFAESKGSKDPFSSLVLKCDQNRYPEGESSWHWWAEHQQWLYWPYPQASSTISQRLMDVLVPDRELERGMFCTKSKRRIQKLHCICNAEGMNVRKALSFRRHLMQQWNPKLSLSQLRLGTGEQARQAALLCKAAVQEYLQKRVDFYTKEDQAAHIRQHRQPGQPYPPTPDFVLEEPFRLYLDQQRYEDIFSLCCKWPCLLFLQFALYC